LDNLSTNKNSVLNKLPQITLGFWIMKIAATTLGETGGDHLSKTLGLGYWDSTLIFFGAFLLLVSSQLLVKKFHPLLYWAVIVGTSTTGTTMSDCMDRTWGLGYEAGSAILLGILLAILGLWRLSGNSMSVDNVRTRKVEILYWTAILFSNTLGTALGDYSSDKFKDLLGEGSTLQYFAAAGLFGFLIAAVAAAAYFTKISRVLLFWIAFVLTRPFGASFGDVLARDQSDGGVGAGTGLSSLVLLGILIVGIGIVLVKMRRQAALEPVPVQAERPATDTDCYPESRLQP
jgi:uncharacterized membrane-anchored protein